MLGEQYPLILQGAKDNAAAVAMPQQADQEERPKQGVTCLGYVVAGSKMIAAGCMLASFYFDPAKPAAAMVGPSFMAPGMVMDGMAGLFLTADNKPNAFCLRTALTLIACGVAVFLSQGLVVSESQMDLVILPSCLSFLASVAIPLMCNLALSPAQMFSMGVLAVGGIGGFAYRSIPGMSTDHTQRLMTAGLGILLLNNLKDMAPFAKIIASSIGSSVLALCCSKASTEASSLEENSTSCLSRLFCCKGKQDEDFSDTASSIAESLATQNP